MEIVLVSLFLHCPHVFVWLTAVLVLLLGSGGQMREQI